MYAGPRSILLYEIYDSFLANVYASINERRRVLATDEVRKRRINKFDTLLLDRFITIRSRTIKYTLKCNCLTSLFIIHPSVGMYIIYVYVYYVCVRTCTLEYVECRIMRHNRSVLFVYLLWRTRFKFSINRKRLQGYCGCTKGDVTKEEGKKKWKSRWLQSCRVQPSSGSRGQARRAALCRYLDI